MFLPPLLFLKSSCLDHRKWQADHTGPERYKFQLWRHRKHLQSDVQRACRNISQCHLHCMCHFKGQSPLGQCSRLVNSNCLCGQTRPHHLLLLSKAETRKNMGCTTTKNHWYWFVQRHEYSTEVLMSNFIPNLVSNKGIVVLHGTCHNNLWKCQKPSLTDWY